MADRPPQSPDLARLYEAYAEPLLSFLVYRTGDHELAEDVLADTFERALRARRRFSRRRGSEKTWLYAIALNRLRDQMRRRATEMQALDQVAAESSGESAASALEDRVASRDALGRALETLSAGEREVLALRYGADLTLPEIAKVTKERLPTVRGRIYRALAKLRDEIGQGP